MASPRSMSLQPSRSTSVSDTTDHLSTSPSWSQEQEARLRHCQAELKKAQKRWSASQDLWIEEVDHLLDLKKSHHKMLKKQQASAKKAAGIWKKRTWKGLSRTSSNVDTTTSTPPDDDADDEGEDEEQEAEDEEDCLSPLERYESMQEFPISSSTQQSRRSSLSKAVRRLSIVGIRSRRKTSAASSNANPSANHSGAVTPTTPGIVPEGTLV